MLNSPEYGDDTVVCLTRGVNWDIKTQGYLTGSQKVRLFVIQIQANSIRLAKMLTVTLFKPQLQEIITRNDNYGSRRGFRAAVESTPHANPHNLLGGHIRSFSSPADPLFWSHHAFIDKIWSAWQNCHDHDEVRIDDVERTQYQPTTPNTDGFMDPFVFKFPALNGGGEGPEKCLKSDESGCKACVHGVDGWCASNDWDSQCVGVCGKGDCETACSRTAGSNPIRTPKVRRSEHRASTERAPSEHRAKRGAFLME